MQTNIHNKQQSHAPYARNPPTEIVLYNPQRHNQKTKHKEDNMQFLASATIGAVTGNKIARYRNANRSFQLKNDALPIATGTAVPPVFIEFTKWFIEASVLQPTKLRLLQTAIAGAIIAYSMTPKDTVTEDKKTNNKNPNDTQSVSSNNNSNPQPISTTQSITTQNLPQTEHTPQNNDVSETINDRTHKYWLTQITSFFPNLFANQKPKEKKPVILTAKQKRLQDIEERQTERRKKAEEEKARRAEAKAERAEKIFKEHGLTLEEYEKKCAIETIKKPKENAQQTLSQAFDRLLKNLDDDLKPYLPAENYNNLRDNINRELRDTFNIDAPDTHDYEKIFAAGDAGKIKLFVSAYRPQYHKDWEKEEEYSKLLNNPDVMGLAKDIAKTLKNSKQVSEYNNLIYALQEECKKINNDIQNNIEINSKSFDKITSMFKENHLDSIKALSPETKKYMIDKYNAEQKRKLDEHNIIQRRQLHSIFKKILDCAYFIQPVDDGLNYNAYDIRHHHDRYIGNTLKRPEEKQRLNRIKEHIAEFEKISQDETVFSAEDVQSFKSFCEEQEWGHGNSNRAGIQYKYPLGYEKTQNPYLDPNNINKVRSEYPKYTTDDIKNTQNPLEKLKKIILQARQETTLFNMAYHEVNVNANVEREANFRRVKEEQQAEYRAWVKAERERKEREQQQQQQKQQQKQQQQNTGNTPQSQPQDKYNHRNLNDAVKKEMFVYDAAWKSIKIVNKYLGSQAKTIPEIFDTMLPHDTSKTAEDYNKTQSKNYRKLQGLYHPNKDTAPIFSQEDKKIITKALSSISALISSLNNIDYHFNLRNANVGSDNTWEKS